MAKNNNLTDFLTGLATKIRTVNGTSGTINPQDFENWIADTYTKGYNDNALKIDSGTFELDADSSTFTQSGIVDSNGNSFTPDFVVAIFSDSAATTHALGAHRVIAFFKRNSVPFAARICTYGSAVDTIRTNPSTTGITSVSSLINVSKALSSNSTSSKNSF